MKNIQLQNIKTISEYHKLMGIPQPEHPLISVIPFESIRCSAGADPKHIVIGYYSIALKKTTDGKMKYGQLEYDFNTGIMSCMAPGQVLKIEVREEKPHIHSGWLLLVHPDFLWRTLLARKIKQYEYFGYSVNEALHLSDKEEAILVGIIQNIQQEYRSNIDQFSQDVIIANLELLLTYGERFYHRQFITRKIANHKILERLEDILAAWFNSDDLQKNGLPTVQYIAGALNVSPNYLSVLLKTLTGQSTQQHIHDKLIEKAKEKLSTTSLSVSEIAWDLGFEHSQSFNKLFKSKTNLSPLEFRQAFN
jgi:AraC-like DNA-binding protein